MKRLALILLLLLAGGRIPASESAAPVTCLPLRSASKADVPFGTGESLTYVVHYKWGVINSDVAKGYVTVDSTRMSGKDVFRCRIYGRTAKFYDPFFKVREDFRTWLTMDGLVPLRFTRDTKEGGYYARDEYRYIRHGGDMHIAASLDSKTKGQRSLNLPLNDCTFDFLSLLFLARNVDVGRLQVGHKYNLSFALDDDVDNIYLVYKGREVRNVKNIGKVRTLKFAVQLVENEQFNDGTDMHMWLTDDGNRIPVLFEMPIKFGVVSGYLESREGLKYPMQSLVNE